MKSKIISIIGPTATGKSSLALKVAKQVLESSKYAGIDIISVDSRQVYKGLEVVSGADLPTGFKAKIMDSGSGAGMTVWEKGKIKLHGISIIGPDQEWSLAHFRQLALPIIANAQGTKRLIILVGGTGLYHDRLFETDTQITVKPNQKLRKKLEKLPILELQNELQKLDKPKFSNMNQSDKNNPRRLIRTIEVASAAAESNASLKPKLWIPAYAGMTVGLTDTLENIENKIRKRVGRRFVGDAVQEVRALLKKYDNDKNLSALSATGVKEIGKYLNQELDKGACLAAWTLREYQYAKRQITWWKQKPDIIWYKVSDKEWQNKALKRVANFAL